MTAIYSSTGAPSFKTKAVFFAKDGKTVDHSVKIQFVNGVYKTDDADIEKYLDKLIAQSTNFAQIVRKIDRAAAERVSKEWQAEHATKNMVSRGGTNSEDANLAKRAQQARNEFISEGHSPKVADQLVKEMMGDNNYAMTDEVDPQVSSPSEGFVPGSDGKPADPQADMTKSVPEGSPEEAASAQELASAPPQPQPNPFSKSKG